MLSSKSQMLVAIGVAQVGVIVQGTFCCASFIKQAKMNGLENQQAHSFPFFFFNYGIIAMLIPLVWTALAVYRSERDAPSRLKNLQGCIPH